MYSVFGSRYGIFGYIILLLVSLEVFADVGYAREATDRRSVSGGAIMCGGACLCWFSGTQKCVALSTSEAECAALDDAVKELLFSKTGVAFHTPR